MNLRLKRDIADTDQLQTVYKSKKFHRYRRATAPILVK